MGGGGEDTATELTVDRQRPGHAVGVIVAFVGIAAAALLLARGLARSSDPAGHLEMLGPYSPFWVTYLGTVAIVLLACVAWLPRRALWLGPATLAIGGLLALTAAAALVGHVDAVMLHDWTLLRPPPTEETGNALATVIAFVRVTLIPLGLFVGGIALAHASLAGGRRRLGPVLTGVGLAMAAAVQAVLGWAARALPAVGLSALALVVLVANVDGFRFQSGDTATFSVAGRFILDGRVPYRDIWAR